MTPHRKAIVAFAVLGMVACGLNLDSVSSENDLNSQTGPADDSGSNIVVLPDGAIAILLDGALVPYDPSDADALDDSGAIVDTGVAADTGVHADTGVPIVDSGSDTGADAGCSPTEVYCPSKMKCIAGLTCNMDCGNTITCPLPSGAQCISREDCIAAVGGGACNNENDCPLETNVCVDVGPGPKKCMPCMGLFNNESCRVGKCMIDGFVAACK